MNNLLLFIETYEDWTDYELVREAENKALDKARIESYSRYSPNGETRNHKAELRILARKLNKEFPNCGWDWVALGVQIGWERLTARILLALEASKQLKEFGRKIIKKVYQVRDPIKRSARLLYISRKKLVTKAVVSAAV